MVMCSLRLGGSQRLVAAHGDVLVAPWWARGGSRQLKWLTAARGIWLAAAPAVRQFRRLVAAPAASGGRADSVVVIHMYVYTFV